MAMGSLLSQLIPTAIVGAIAPLPITVAITLLMSKRGLAKALGFAVAMTAVFAVIGVITLSTASVDAGSSEKGSAITGTIVAVLGAVLLLIAVKQLLRAPDPDAPPPRFMTKLDTMSPPGAAVFGAIIALINVKQLGIYVAGVSQIVNADVSTGQGWIALAVLLVVIELGVIAPILTYVLARDWATRVLGGFRGWLIAHNRVISIVLGLGVGTAFLVKGITQIG
jgi:Sap, sulfolipid-1-addressing protein